MKDLPTFSYFATVGGILPKMGDFEEEQREEVDALVSIFSRGDDGRVFDNLGY